MGLREIIYLLTYLISFNNKILGTDGFTGEVYQIFKGETISMLYELLKKRRKYTS